jgi:hypothetical protein
MTPRLRLSATRAGRRLVALCAGVACLAAAGAPGGHGALAASRQHPHPQLPEPDGLRPAPSHPTFHAPPPPKPKPVPPPPFLSPPLPAPGTPEGDLASIIDDVGAATGSAYAERDDQGHTLDCLKIINGPGALYVGIYHTGIDGGYTTELATSTDLLRWTWRTAIDTHASQPTISELGDGTYLVAEEADNIGIAATVKTWLRFRHFANFDALVADVPDRTFDAPHTQARRDGGSEGTPDIISGALHPDIDHSAITVGFHFLAAGSPDRQARGVLVDFSSWTASPAVVIDDALSAEGGRGKHGDRDAVSFEGATLQIHEAQITADDDRSWRVFLYRPGQPGPATLLNVHTNGRSHAFANPTISRLLSPSGRPAIVVTLYLPPSADGPGEAGELVYYTETPLAA